MLKSPFEKNELLLQLLLCFNDVWPTFRAKYAVMTSQYLRADNMNGSLKHTGDDIGCGQKLINQKIQMF